MSAFFQRMLAYWPAVGLPVGIIAALVLGLQQSALSRQLVDLRGDLGGVKAEVRKLRQEIRQLKTGLETAPEADALPTTPPPAAPSRAAKATKARKRRKGQ